MERGGVLKLLGEHKPRLADRYGVSELVVFGSMVRGVADADSAVDVSVAFDRPATSAHHVGVMFTMTAPTEHGDRQADGSALLTDQRMGCVVNDIETGLGLSCSRASSSRRRGSRPLDGYQGEERRARSDRC